MAWYEKNYRRNLIDMHIEDWDDSFMASFDPEKYVAMLQKAKVIGFVCGISVCRPS